MPVTPKNPEPAAEAPLDAAYPNVESFIETADREQVGQLFQELREGLSDLKGPKKDQAKKVQAALEKTEELLSFLIEVREKLAEERAADKKDSK